MSENKEEKQYYNEHGRYNVGDLVGISSQVIKSDNIKDYADESGILRLIRVHRHDGGDIQSGRVILESVVDGRETDRAGWAIKEITGSLECYECINMCKDKDKEECPFKEEREQNEL